MEILKWLLWLICHEQIRKCHNEDCQVNYRHSVKFELQINWIFFGNKYGTYCLSEILAMTGDWREREQPDEAGAWRLL